MTIDDIKKQIHYDMNLTQNAYNGAMKRKCYESASFQQGCMWELKRLYNYIEGEFKLQKFELDDDNDYILY